MMAQFWQFQFKMSLNHCWEPSTGMTTAWQGPAAGRTSCWPHGQEAKGKNRGDQNSIPFLKYPSTMTLEPPRRSLGGFHSASQQHHPRKQPFNTQTFRRYPRFTLEQESSCFLARNWIFGSDAIVYIVQDVAWMQLGVLMCLLCRNKQCAIMQIIMWSLRAWQGNH